MCQSTKVLVFTTSSLKLMLCTKITTKDHDLKQRMTKNNEMGSTRQVCLLLLRELSFQFSYSLEELESQNVLNIAVNCRPLFSGNNQFSTNNGLSVLK